jgi:hypothetical protein
VITRPLPKKTNPEWRVKVEAAVATVAAALPSWALTVIEKHPPRLRISTPPEIGPCAGYYERTKHRITLNSLAVEYLPERMLQLVIAHEVCHAFIERAIIHRIDPSDQWALLAYAPLEEQLVEAITGLWYWPTAEFNRYCREQPYRTPWVERWE